VKSTISGIINLGIMMLVMWLMTTLMKPLTSAEKPKKVKASTEKPEQLEEAKT
jgi:Na+/phosphate symporter